MTTSSDRARIYRHIADVLTELADDAEDLGTTLCANPVIAADHMVQMQGIDLFTQTLRQLSDVLAADDPAHVVSSVNLETLRERLLIGAPLEVTQV